MNITPSHPELHIFLKLINVDIDMKVITQGDPKNTTHENIHERQTFCLFSYV